MSLSLLGRSRRGVALLLAGVLALAGVFATDAAGVSPANASPDTAGEVLAASVEITDDGVSSVPGDASAADGKLAIGNEAAFRWEIETSGAANAHLEQSLPVGWQWDVDSAVAAGLQTVSESLGYRASFQVSGDGRTLSAKVGSIANAETTQTIRFAGIRARVDRSTAQTGEQYVPTLTITDETGAREATPQVAPLHLETVGTLGVDLRAQWFNGDEWTDQGEPRTEMEQSTHDFGSGEVAAGSARFRIGITRPEGVGDRPYQLQVPRKLSGTFSLSQNGSPWDGTVDVALDDWGWGYLAGEVEFDRAAGTFTVTVTEDPQVADNYVDLLFFIPRGELSDATEAVRLESSVQLKEPWRTVESQETVTETNSTNNRFGSVLTSWDDPAPWSITQHVGGQFSGPGHNVPYGAAVPGEDLTADGYYMPSLAQDPVTNRFTVTPARNLSVMQLWDPNDLQLNPDLAVPYTASRTRDEDELAPIDPDDLRFLLTTDRMIGTAPGESSDEEEPSDLNWVEAEEYTGDLARVSGVRMDYLGNEGVWDAGGTTSSTTGSILPLQVSLRVAREAPVQTDPEDTGEVRLIHAGGEDGATLWPRTRSLTIRHGQGTMTATGAGVNANGELVTPASKTIMAGQGVRYTIRPQLETILFGDSLGSRAGVTNLETRACVSPFATNIDFSSLDEKHWSAEIVAEHRVCAAEETELRFAYLLPATYLDPLADIVFDIETSQIAPPQSKLGLTAALFGDGIAPKAGAAGDAAATASVDMNAAQPSVARVELGTSTPVVEARNPMTYRVQWFNFTGASRKASNFVDVLPYDGDPRGTKVTGEVVLTAAALTSHESAGATLELTTDPKIREGQTGRAPATGVDWVPYADATPAQISSATALRVGVRDHRPGPESVGTLEVSLSALKAGNDEVLKNSVSGMLDIGGENTRLAESKPVTIRIESAEIRGSVWNDVNRDGDPGNEPGLGGVSLALLDRTGTPVPTADGTPWTEFTADDGSYRFSGLAAGEYRVTADPGTAEPAGHWVATAEPVGTDDAEQATFRVSRGDVRSDVNFGFARDLPEISLSQTITGPESPEPGQPVSFSFEVTNTGPVALTEVALTGDLAGIGPIEFGSWPDGAAPGELGSGDSVSATTSRALTQADIDGLRLANEGTVTAASALGESVTASDPAELLLHGIAGIDLEKAVAPATGAEPQGLGDSVEFTYTVQNAGNQTLTGVTVDDPLPGLSDVEVTEWPGETGTLLPGQRVTGTASVTVTQQHLDTGRVHSTATVTGTDPRAERITDSAEAGLPLQQQAGLSLVKTGVIASGPLAVGVPVTYSFVVTNTGDQRLSRVGIEDSMPGLSELVFTWPTNGAPGTLAPGERVTATATVTLTQADLDRGMIQNAATVTGETANGETVTAEDSSVRHLSAGTAQLGGETDRASDRLGRLPITGGSLTAIALLAIALLAAGAVLRRART